MEEDGGFLVVAGMAFEDGDVAIWVQAVDEAGARRGRDAQVLCADGDASIGANEDGGAQEGAREEVLFGATVTLRAADGALLRYRIVGVDEVHLSPGAISWVAARDER